MNGMKKKALMLFVALGMFVLALPMCRPSASDAVTLTSITAYYSGTAVTVGTDISRDNISVTAVYSDASTAKITDYTLVSATVTDVGVNTFTVIYQGKTASFYVSGIKPSSLYAAAKVASFSVGNSVANSDILLIVTYSDGTVTYPTDFTLSNYVITAVGTQTVYVNYGTLTARVNVIGVEPKSIKSLNATYSGTDIVQGNNAAASDLSVIAVYTDNTTEKINNYNLVPAVLNDTGSVKVTVTFSGVNASFKVNVIPKTVKSVTVTYTGGSVLIGKYVDRDFVKVTAKYNDGTSADVTDFTLLGSRILLSGTNTVYADYTGLKDSFEVQGVSSVTLDYDSAPSYEIKNEKSISGTLSLILEDENLITVRNRKSTKLSNKLKKKMGIDSTSVVIVFDVALSDPLDDNLMPLSARISLPSSFKAAYTSLFYIPGRKSVAAKINAAVTSAGKFEFDVNYEGTYALVYTPYVAPQASGSTSSPASGNDFL